MTKGPASRSPRGFPVLPVSDQEIEYAKEWRRKMDEKHSKQTKGSSFDGRDDITSRYIGRLLELKIEEWFAYQAIPFRRSQGETSPEDLFIVGARWDAKCRSIRGEPDPDKDDARVAGAQFTDERKKNVHFLFGTYDDRRKVIYLTGMLRRERFEQVCQFVDVGARLPDGKENTVACYSTLYQNLTPYPWK